jgi:hypothetical protein
MYEKKLKKNEIFNSKNKKQEILNFMINSLLLFKRNYEEYFEVIIYLKILMF